MRINKKSSFDATISFKEDCKYIELIGTGKYAYLWTCKKNSKGFESINTFSGQQSLRRLALTILSVTKPSSFEEKWIAENLRTPPTVETAGIRTEDTL